MANEQGDNDWKQDIGQEPDRQQQADRQQNQASQHGSGQSGYGSGSEDSGAGASEQNDHYGYQDGRDHDRERGDRQ